MRRTNVTLIDGDAVLLILDRADRVEGQRAKLLGHMLALAAPADDRASATARAGAIVAAKRLAELSCANCCHVMTSLCETLAAAEDGAALAKSFSKVAAGDVRCWCAIDADSNRRAREPS